MSKIHIKMLSEDALAYSKKNSEYIAKKLSVQVTNKWIFDDFPQPLFIEKKFEIDDFELENNSDLKDKELDFKNSVKLYESLKSLPRYILCDQRFWLWLHFDKFYNVTRNMVKINGASTFENMWLHTQGVRRGIMFGVLSRCFFRVALSVDESQEDKYLLTKWVIDNPLRYRNLTWRAFSSEAHLVRGILKGEKRAIDENPTCENTKYYEEIGKYIQRNIGSVMLLDVISEEDISNMVYEEMIELINRGKK